MLTRFLLGLLVLLGVRLLARFLAGMVRGLRPADPRKAPDQGIDLVRDPVCKTFLPRTNAVRAVLGGHEAHFCSEVCRDKALAAARRD